MADIRIIEYVDRQSRSPFALWFEGLNPPAAIYQMAAGNWSKVKGVGSGVFERKIDFGPGYRVYFGKDAETVVILLGGSSKQRQHQAIEAAQKRWADYRRRKMTNRLEV